MRHVLSHPLVSQTFVLATLLLGLTATPTSAQTLDFDTLPSEQGVATDVPLTTANGGSRTISGVTFNAGANSDWEIVGNQFVPLGSAGVFARSHSGAYALAGNTYVGSDFNGTVYTGLTLSTTRPLTSLYVGFDDNGGGSNDADTLTITAFGAGGDLASESAIALSGPDLSLLDTSSVFNGLAGVTGYRFETTASNDLYAANGQAYLIADDLTFGAPVPEASPAADMGIGLALGAALLLARRIHRRVTPSANF